MFLDNKYTKIYYQIVDRAKSRTLEEGYKEKHHIIPKSFGGSNNKENLVELTAREHFICHWLLVKMTTDANRAKMVYGLRMMNRYNEGHQRHNNIFTSRIYQYYKEEFVKEHIRRITGHTVSAETRQKLSDSQKGKKITGTHLENLRAASKNKPPVKDETRSKLREAFYKNNAINSPESIEKRRAKRMDHVVTDETRDKIKATLKNTYRKKGFKVKDDLPKKKPYVQKGQKRSEETKAKMRKPKSPEARENMRLASIKREALKRHSLL